MKLPPFAGFLLAILLVSAPSSGLTNVYVVRSGDSLWEIADRFGTSIQSIKKLNKLRSNRIYPGQKLQVGKEIRQIHSPNGPYFWSQPKSERQGSRSYLESSRASAIEDFRRADQLMHAYKADAARRFSRLKRRDRPLRGWTICLDPGHGGRDPGAIASNKDGRKRDVHVVEDEYVYDLTFRVMEQLMLYGADVGLTVISPNHLKRDNLPAGETFVNEQNEVYNDERYNRRKDPMVRPGSHNIKRRVMVANRLFKSSGSRRTLFISIHADNSPNRPKGPLVLYQKRGNRIDKESRKFARVMKKALGHRTTPSQIGARNLAVLRDNRARAEVLVEIRNVSNVDDAWALRFHGKRQEDADRIVRGVLDYVK